jgi:hypothetical protein
MRTILIVAVILSLPFVQGHSTPEEDKMYFTKTAVQIQAWPKNEVLPPAVFISLHGLPTGGRQT